jgi:putative nucleotidyltransferase with HDIG domain
VGKAPTRNLPGSGVRAVDPARLERRRRRRLMSAIAVGASLVLAAILTIELLPVGPLPMRGGLPEEGEIAEVSYKAPADIRIVDRDATEELRRAAVEQAPAIYDFDERRALAMTEQIRAGFQAARAAVPAEGSEEEPGDPVAAFREALAEDLELGDEQVAVLERRGFAPDDEHAVLSTFGSVAARMIVDDHEEFLRQIDKRPVVVRDLGSGRERRLSGPESVLGIEAARELIGKQAERVLAERGKRDRKELTEFVVSLVRPNVGFNLRATDERRQSAEANVKDVTITLRKGEIIVRDGDPITARHVRILSGVRDEARGRSQIESFIGVAGALLLLLVVIWRFGSSNVPRFPRQPKDAIFLLSSLAMTALGTRIGLFLCDAIAGRPELETLLDQSAEPLYFAIPVAAAAMLVRLVESAETAALFAVLASILVGLQLQGEVTFTLFALVGSLVGAIGVARVTQRGILLRAGLRVGLTNAAVVAMLVLVRGNPTVAATLLAVGLGFTGGVLSGILVSGLAPLVETVFAYTTDIKLLELANREQPLLRQLELSAPGTYHHSMMVGHLAEKAAEAIGANALLAKVAGYYHDIGKMRRPHFFVENVTAAGAENRHEKLAPSMSARIIQAHVKDGLELGRQHKLSPPIMSGIGEHHGTSVIRFFYEKAKEQAQPDKAVEVREHDYRYPGPKPQTREAGILMLADSVEAASRTLADTSAARIQQLVQRIINNYFRDGQLDDCSLTLRDLNAIARSFIETLSAIRHERIDYPEATEADGRRLEEAPDEGVVERLEPRQKDRQDRAAAKRKDDLKRLGLS